jgi:hypothetical protein
MGKYSRNFTRASSFMKKVAPVIEFSRPAGQTAAPFYLKKL